MESALTASEMNKFPAAVAAAQPAAEDDLAFFRALWLWIPAALALWSVLIWGVIRIV